MKKVLLFRAAMLLLVGANAQNKFRGIVKYKLESTGQVAVTIPEEQANVEVKVYESKLLSGTTLQDGFKVMQAMDFSQLIAYLASQGVELETYQGDGKFLVVNNFTKEWADSLLIEDKEPGHFYMEYVEGETKDVCGYKAKKCVFHQYTEEGEHRPIVFWYTPELGPEYNMIFGVCIKGMPLQFSTSDAEGHEYTYTCVDVVKGKVKPVDMLVPAGYKEASGEEWETFSSEMEDAMELFKAMNGE